MNCHSLQGPYMQQVVAIQGLRCILQYKKIRVAPLSPKALTTFVRTLVLCVLLITVQHVSAQLL